jgi:peptidoglycan/xylan/chitin deacetylase (PgdA/CDA1 family)
MSRHSTKLLKATLSALHYSRADRLLAPYTRGEGVIFMLHHVLPERPPGFAPNRILEVTPAFLEATVRQVIEAGFDPVSLDEAHDRMRRPRVASRPFVCFTFDDGYKDNKVYAYPILKRHGVPFTVYVPTDYPDGEGELWWLVLEEVVRAAPEVTVRMDGSVRSFACATVSEKYDAFHQIYWWLRSSPEFRARALVRELAGGLGIDWRDLCRRLVMSWDEIRELASDPLVTIGAHTQRHLALAGLEEGVLRAEMEGSLRRIEHEIGRPCRHFSYPYGDARSAGEREFAAAAELGVKTAVTTRKGVIGAGAAGAMTALPRVSLNGDYQDPRYVKVFLSGAPFRCLDWFRRIAPLAIS